MGKGRWRYLRKAWIEGCGRRDVDYEGGASCYKLNQQDPGTCIRRKCGAFPTSHYCG